MINKRTCIYIAVVFVFALAAGFVYIKGNFFNARTAGDSDNSFVIDKSQPIAESQPDAEQTQPSAASSVQVHITGAVKNPGVYEVAAGSRINDVLAEAGGETDEADLDLINLASYVEDAQKIRIPAQGEEIQPSTQGGGLININTASREELTALPGIGEVTADAIVRYREQNGAFEAPEDIKNVARIGEKTYEALKDLITVTAVRP